MTNSYSIWAQTMLTVLIISFYSCIGQNSPGSEKNLEAQVITSASVEIDKLVNSYAENGDFNGAILVSEGGEIMYKKGFGLANMEWNIPNQSDTKFRIGSITKQFTAMLVVQLIVEGKLDLDKPLSTFLPDYPSENGKKITIHHLLTHTSGIPNSYESTKEKPIRPDSYTADALVEEFATLPLEFIPGEKFSYSNAGYTLLGYLAEKVTGKRYEELLQEYIFTPLQMNNTGFDKHRKRITKRASGYFNSWGEYYNSNYIDMSTVYAAGGLYSTVEDLSIWDRALYTATLIPNEYLNLSFVKHVEDPDYGGHYGYGWSIKDKPIGNSEDVVETIGHDGVIDGFCAVFTRIPSTNSSIILLSNVRRAPLNAMTKGIMGILYDKDYDTPKKSLAYSLLDVIYKDGIEKGKAYYHSVKNDADFYIVENEMNIVSYRLLESDRTEDAAAVLRLGIEAFPNAFNLYDSYGEVLRKLGKNEESIENYKKSIELNPENQNGKRILKEMGVDL